MNEVMWSRNRIIISVYWVMAIIGAGYAFISPDTWVTIGIAIPSLSILTYLNVKRKATAMLPKIITFSTKMEEK